MDELIDVLKEKQMDFTYNDKKQIAVQTSNEEGQNIFLNSLSSYISYVYFREHLKEVFLKQGVSAKEAEKMVKQALDNMTNAHYFYTFTNVLVKEYFKKMTSMNVESFFLFNMKGFKEEIKQFAKRMMDFYSVNQQDSEQELEDVGVKNLFAGLSERAEANGLNLAHFKELHVHQVGQYLHFKNKEGIVIDEDFFLTYFGSVMQFDIGAKVENPELFEGMLLGSCIINIFDVKKVVIHKSLTNRAKDILLFNLNAMKRETGKKIQIVMCNGCDHCE
jgi:hypothetical protein